MKNITNNHRKEINEKLPSLRKLIEREDTDYQMIFVSVFDHWLTQDEFQSKIHTKDSKEISIRRENLKLFAKGLFNLTPTFTWRIKRKNRFFIYPFNSEKQILNKVDIQNQHGESGQRYDVILPEIEAVYSEEWDWTNIIWYRDQEKVERLIELAKCSGLYILKK
jgi:hypothetical protein